MSVKDELQAAQTAQTENTEGKNNNGLQLVDLSAYPNANLFKASLKGIHKLDFLPWRCTTNNYMHVKKGSLAYVYDVWVHGFVGAFGDTVPCNKRNGKGACPVCEEANRLWDDFKKGGETDKDLEKKARALFARRKVIYNVVDTADPGKGAQLFITSFTNFHEKLERAVSNAKEEGKIIIIADYEEGKSVKFNTFEETFNKSPYANFENFSFVDRSNQYTDAILEDVFPLDRIIKHYDYDFIEARFYGREIATESVTEDEPLKITPASDPTVNKTATETTVTITPISEPVSEISREERIAIAKAKKEQEALDAAQTTVPDIEEPMACPSGLKFGYDNFRSDDCVECIHNEACDEHYKKLKAAGLVK